MLWRLRTIWRIVREVDLESIRRTAQALARVTIIGDEGHEAEHLAELLGGPDWAANSAIDVVGLTLSPARMARSSADAAKEGEAEGTDVVVLVAKEPGLTPSLAATRRELSAAGMPILTIVTGTGKLQTEKPANGERARLDVPSLDERASVAVMTALLGAVEPDVRLALARRLPRLRPLLFNILTEETARANASYSFTTGLAEVFPVMNVPVVVGDVLILTKNQVVMGYRIALAAGKTGEPRQLIGEIVSVVGGALLFRQIARELVGLLPVIGIVPKVAVAYGGTWAIGKAVTMWVDQGIRVNNRSFRALLRRGVERGRETAEQMAAGERTA